jgi:hypothetical protein
MKIRNTKMSIYNQYPGDTNQYPKGTPTDYPFPSQYFTEYNENQIIGESSNKDQKANLIVTSGKLYAKTYEGRKQAFTDTYNFRMILNGMTTSTKNKVGWTNSIITICVTPVVRQPNAPTWAGIHIFSRYRTSDDLYVGSLRFDGLVTIKKLIKGVYTTLVESAIPTPVLGRQYKLQFTTKDNNLSFFVDGVKIVSVDDGSMSWGTCGLRVDYTDCYIESVRMTTPSMSNKTENAENAENVENELLVEELSEEISDVSYSNECDSDIEELDSYNNSEDELDEQFDDSFKGTNENYVNKVFNYFYSFFR